MSIDAIKRVLLIAYYYPPFPMIGALRPHGLRKYLPEHGWDVLVLTTRLESSRDDRSVIETDYRDILSQWKKRLGFSSSRGLHDQLGLPVSSSPNRRLLHTRVIDAAKVLITYPDSMKGWVPFASKILPRLASTNKIDAIISTSPPISCHMIGAKAKQITGAPWIADFRDLWVRDPVMNLLMTRILKTSDELVTVSPALAKRLEEAYPERPTSCITNGFDDSDFLAHSSSLTKRFSITHTGRMYEGKRDPSSLLSVVRELADTGEVRRDDIDLRFYGPIDPFLPAMVHRFGLEDICEIHESVPRTEALALQARSQLLLLLEWGVPGEQGIFTGKLFEYLGSKRPILSVGQDPGIASILKETSAGTQTSNLEELRRYIRNAYLEFKRNGFVSYLGKDQEISKYNHSEMAARFAGELNRLTKRATCEQSIAIEH